MKKILFFASALAGLFLAASCQRESLEPEVSGNVVSYTIQVPGALSTKVIGENVSAVNELVYEVYRTEATAADDYTQTETKLFRKTAVIEDGTATVDFELVNNQNFRVLFWAHVNTQENPSVYTTTDLKNVTLSQSLTANAESYSAFAGSDFIKYGDNINGRTVTLVRPIAQLNIATAPGSLDLEGQTTVKMTTTGVTVTGLSTSYNVAQALAGDVATTPFTYTAAAVSGLSGLSEQKLSVNGTEYDYVAMNYVGFAEQSGSNVEVSYTINTENVGTISNTIKNVPVKANYRTNIVGNLITSMSDYKITLDSDWADEPDEPYVVEVVSVSTAKELQDAINDIIDGAEGNIKLEGDINLNDLVGLLSTKAAPAYGLLIPETKTVVLDLGGYTLTGNAIVDGSKVHVIVNNGTLTIMNGTLTANGTNGGSAISNNGTLTITDATVNGASSDTATGTASYAVNSQGTESKLVVNNSTINGRGVIGATKGTKVEINGGTYHTPAVAWGHAVYADGEGTEVVINDGTFSEGYEASANNWGMYQIYSANKAKVTVNGGKFMPWDCANGYDLCTATEGTIVIYGGSFAEDPSNQNGINYVADGYPVNTPETEGDYYTIGEFTPVAKIGGEEYGSLRAAIAAVEDGGTITMIADEVFTMRNRVNNGGSWYEGLLYDGDKSFTLDLGGKTLSQDGAVNDYLIYFKNNGEKANTITIKNGTIDAGTNAYAALATASSNAQKITMNLENVSINGNNSGGAVVKFRGGGELNVKAGTVITGEDNYCGIEVYGTETIANIYEGVKIYQNGTTSYVGAIAGVSGNATMNVYGGKGVSAKCGLIVMSSGGTINVEGGEWTANTDGTPKDDNFGVLVSQFDNATYPTAVSSVINVAGGTFRGGYNCYGNVADKAFIHISGGNFNADPTDYLVAGYEITEENGLYTVGIPKSQIAFEAAIAEGGTVTLEKDVTLVSTVTVAEGNEVVLDLNGKTITGTMHKSVGAVLKNNGTLTIKNGTISSTAANGGSAVVNNGTLTVEEATLNGAPNADGSWPSYTVNNTGVMTATKTKITSYHGALCSYGEGAEATLNDSEIDMAGIPGFTSHGIYTYSNGKVVVNGGTYANKATDQHGTGGSVINGVVEVTAGTFSGRIEAYYGTPELKGGTYSEKPAASYVPAGYGVEANGDGTFSVVKLSPVAKIGEIEYYSLQEAFNAGGEIFLLRNVKLTEKAVLEAGKTVVLDLNGFAVTVPETTGNHIYALDNKGTLTIKDSKENGSISSRGIYNYGTLTLDSGKLSAIDGNGGYAVNNEPGATFVMNGGWIAADYEDGDEPEGSNYDATALDVPSGAEATLNGGKITNAGNYTFAVSAAGTLNIPTTSTLTIVGRHGAIAVSGGLTTVSAGSYSIPENTLYTDNVVYVEGGELVINGGTFTGDADKAQGGACVSHLGGKVTINGGVYGKSSGGDVYGVTGSMTIKGGKFENLIETQHIAEGYELNANGEVVKK